MPGWRAWLGAWWRGGDAPVTADEQEETVDGRVVLERCRARYAGDADVTAVCDMLECALVTLENRCIMGASASPEPRPVTRSVTLDKAVTATVTDMKRPLTGAERTRRYRERQRKEGR